MFRTVCILSLLSCGATETDLRGVEYGTTLENCNRTSTTLCESIICENHARTANGRMPRQLPAKCSGKDAGDPDTSIHTTIKDGGTDG